jgi:putative nucleotidyltransferase with HDIG domain
MPSRDEAIALLHEHTKGDQLRKHGLAVEAAMRAYARKHGADEETWGMVGILHDFDYEAHPDEHPYVGAQILRDAGWRRSWRACWRTPRSPGWRATRR